MQEDDTRQCHMTACSFMIGGDHCNVPTTTPAVMAADTVPAIMAHTLHIRASRECLTASSLSPRTTAAFTWTINNDVVVVNIAKHLANVFLTALKDQAFSPLLRSWLCPLFRLRLCIVMHMLWKRDQASYLRREVGDWGRHIKILMHVAISSYSG